MARLAGTGLPLPQASWRPDSTACWIDDVARQRFELPHATDGLDPLPGAQDERILDEVDVTERTSTERRLSSCR